jgi:hypothetical protein
MVLTNDDFVKETGPTDGAADGFQSFATVGDVTCNVAGELAYLHVTDDSDSIPLIYRQHGEPA